MIEDKINKIGLEAEKLDNDSARSFSRKKLSIHSVPKPFKLS
jgi:hypothetical protein